MESLTLLSGHLQLAAYLFLPQEKDWPAPWPAVVIVHGFAGSKDSHTEFGQFLANRGFAALAIDLRGHGQSQGEMDHQVLDDLGAALAYLEAHPKIDSRRIALRGSSLGGSMVIHGGVRYPQVRAVVAICPAWENLILEWVESGDVAEQAREMGLSLRVNQEGLARYLRTHDVRQAVSKLSPRPLFLIHAIGDEMVPYKSTQELYALAQEPKSLLLVPDGNHRSAQHDPAVHEQVVDWLRQVM